MKRYLDIENNIKQFIEDYNRNYNLSKSSISLNVESRHSCYSDTKASIQRRSLSFNAINKNSWNKTTDSSIPLDLHSSYRFKRSKSEADLVGLFNNKNYQYYLDESLSSLGIWNESKQNKCEKKESEQSFSFKNLFHRSCSTVEEFLTQSAVSIVELFSSRSTLSATCTAKCKSDELNTTISSLKLQLTEKLTNQSRKSKRKYSISSVFSCCCCCC